MCAWERSHGWAGRHKELGAAKVITRERERVCVCDMWWDVYDW